MEKIKLFLKGFVVGIGGVSPGLSGSILMVALGLYRNVIDSVATIYRDSKKKILYLLPILMGMLLGAFIFSRIISYFLNTHELPTRLTFFGLLIGAIPLVYGEVKKNNDIKKRHYLIILISFLLCFTLFTLINSVTPAGELGIFQSFIFGVMVIITIIVPGLEAAAFLSTFGLYTHWLDLTSLRIVSLELFIPTLLGIIVGGFLLSKLMSYLFKKDYTITFSVLFGFFLSIIPNILYMNDGSFISVGRNVATYVGIILFFIGLIGALLFGRIRKHLAK